MVRPLSFARAFRQAIKLHLPLPSKQPKITGLLASFLSFSPTFSTAPASGLLASGADTMMLSVLGALLATGGEPSTLSSPAFSASTSADPECAICLNCTYCSSRGRTPARHGLISATHSCARYTSHAMVIPALPFNDLQRHIRPLHPHHGGPSPTFNFQNQLKTFHSFLYFVPLVVTC